MTFKTGERIRETSATTGTGTWTLDGAPTGFQAFSSLGANNLCPYFATEGTNWEAGIGTVLTAPNRLARTTVLSSSNAGSAVNFATTVTIRCGPIGALAIPRKLSKDVAGGAGTTVLTQDEQRYNSIEFTGALTGNRVIEVDATPWTWVVYNNTSGAFTLTVKVTGQTGVVIPQGRRAVIHCDGADVRAAGPQSGSNFSEFASGTRILFHQNTAPLGWTKETNATNYDDRGLRIATGTIGSGGNTAFTSVFGSGKSTSGFALTTNEIPPHGHGWQHTHNNNSKGNDSTDTSGSVAGVSSDGGSGNTHSHGLSLDLKYVDVIIAQKDA